MKRASALLREGVVFVQCYSRTTTCLSVADGSVLSAAIDDPLSMGANVLACLAEVREGVSHPTAAQWKEVQSPMLKAARVGSWKALAKNAKAVGIECDSDRVRLTPTKAYSHNGGEALRANAIDCTLDEVEIGAGLQRAFDLGS